MSAPPPADTPTVAGPAGPASRAGGGNRARRLLLGTACTILVATLVAAACASWFAPFYLHGAAFTATDFGQYCEGIDAAVAGREAANPHRSALVGHVLGWLAGSRGPVDALFLGAGVSVAAVALGLGLQAGATSGRRAGVVAMATCASVAPVALLARTLSYYPEMDAAFALAAGGAAWACARGGLVPCLVGALCVAVAPLADLRGVIWYFPCLVAVLVGALLGPAGRAPAVDRREAFQRGGGRIVVTGLVLWIAGASWSLGPWIWPKGLGGSLERQAWSQVADVGRRAGIEVAPLERLDPSCAPAGGGLVWGRSAPTALPETAKCLVALAGAADALPRSQESERAFARQVQPWLPVVAIGLALGVVRNLRRPRRILALLVTAAPSLVMLLGAANEPDLRRLGQALLAAPVALGVGSEAVLAAGMWVVHRLRKTPFPNAVRGGGAAVGAALLVLVVTGVLPTPLSPAAPWRVRFEAQSEYQGYLAGNAWTRESYERQCVTVLAPTRGSTWVDRVGLKPWP